jgi:hypothetical protein
MLSAVAVSRVARGVAFLNARVPGWEERVDLNTLDIQHLEHCVLGQLFGDYVIGVEELGLKEEGDRLDEVSVHSLGFQASGDEGQPTYADLTEAWKAIIEERRALVAVPA